MSSQRTNNTPSGTSSVPDLREAPRAQSERVFRRWRQCREDPKPDLMGPTPVVFEHEVGPEALTNHEGLLPSHSPRASRPEVVLSGGSGGPCGHGPSLETSRTPSNLSPPDSHHEPVQGRVGHSRCAGGIPVSTPHPDLQTPNTLSPTYTPSKLGSHLTKTGVGGQVRRTETGTTDERPPHGRGKSRPVSH